MSEQEAVEDERRPHAQQILTIYHNPYTGYRPVKRFFNENEEYFKQIGYTFEDVREVLQLYSPIYGSRKLKMPLNNNKLNATPFRNMHMDIFFMKFNNGELRYTADMKDTRRKKTDSAASKKKLHKLVSPSADAVAAMVLVDVPTKFTYARTIKNKGKPEVIRFLKDFLKAYPQAQTELQMLVGDGESAWQDLTMGDILPDSAIENKAPNQVMRLEMEAKGVKKYDDLFKRKLYVPSSSRHGAYLAESAIGQIKLLWKDMLLVKKFSADKSESKMDDKMLESMCHIINSRNGSLAIVTAEPTVDQILSPEDKHFYRIFNVGDLVHVANDVHTMFQKKSLTPKYTDQAFEVVSYSYNTKNGQTYYRVKSLNGTPDQFYLQRSWSTDELMHVSPKDLEDDSLGDYSKMDKLFWQKNARFYY